MRIALLSDIHGNIHGLNAVLDELMAEEIDQYVCLGDVVEHGPNPQEALARILELNCPIVMGNTDERMINDYTTKPRTGKIRPGYEQDVWSAAQLSDKDKAAIRTFQPTVSVELSEDIHFLGFHGSPHSHSDYIVSTKPNDDKLAALLSGFSAKIMAGGHTHMQMIRRVRGILFINPGSIGATNEATADGYRRPWWAEYAVVEVTEQGRVSVDLRRTPYDVEAHLQAYRESDIPHTDLWIAQWDQTD